MKRTLIVLALASLCPAARGDEKPRPVVRCLAYSPDGKALAAGLAAGDAGELLLLDDKAAVKWRQAQPAGVRGVCFLSGGKTIVAAVGPSLLLIDAATGKTRKTLGKHDGAITALAVSSDGKTLASGEDRKVTLWDVAKGEEVRSLQTAGVYSLSLSPDGKRLLCAAGREATTWEVRSGRALAKLTHDGFHVSSAAFLPDGKEVLTGGYDGSARLWDAGAESHKMLLHGLGGVSGLCYEPKTKTLAIWGSFGGVGLFAFDRRPDGGTAKRIAALIAQLDDDDYDKREAAESALVKIGFRAESALRAAKGSKSAEVRIRARRARQTILSRPAVKLEVRARAACFSPDGKTLAIGGDDGAIGLYDVASGKALSGDRK